ncbi:MAG: AAA family ATPase [Desulfomonilia bacterium]|jgi:energy-coupling factor transporter ATP-binding protein EcfA2
MSILQEILLWAQGLPDWQSDAITRLLTKQNLGSEDIEDLFALLKASHGIPDPNGRKPNKLSADQIPAPVKSDTHVELIGIKNLQNVNAIASNHRVTFAPKGLTVIYGDNATGKSGYSRVLKRACRARDQSEPILPNAYLPVTQVGNAEATFEIIVNGETKEERWVNGRVAPESLSTIAIFDHRCARAYLDSDNDFAYVPYGLDVFEGLANICRQLKTKIDQEHAQCAPDLSPFADLHGATVVGNLIEKLSAKTDPKQVEKLATLTSEEINQHEALERSLKESSPKEKAAQLTLRSRRITRIAQNVIDKLKFIDQVKLNEYKMLDKRFLEAQTAATIAARKFKDDSQLLPGTGGEAWRELFEAARKFSKEAYPGKPFPHIEKGAQCPLCQQYLDEGALRLKQFEEFVQQETEKTVQTRRKNLIDAYDLLVALDISLGLDEETFVEIATYDKTLAQGIRAFETAMGDRYAKMKAAFISHEWGDVAAIPASPADKLKALSVKLNKEVETLEKAADKDTRSALQTQFNEFDARIKLSKMKLAVLTAIDKMSRQTKLTKCLSAVKTKPISDKTNEVIEKVVSEKLENTLNAEFKKLGVGNLNVSLQSNVEKGKPLHKLKLSLPQVNSPGNILSEGEQRAIAIGAFLAEVAINGGSGGIVFDDPVSSLDHRFRERVARRLVQEASKRQVIILTHDVYFLCILIEEAGVTGVPITTQSLVRCPEGFGVAESDLPFEGMNTLSRIKSLRAQHQKIAKLYKDGDESEYRKQTMDAYRMLRDTWERAVEEVLLRRVVLRFRKGIETQRLKEVVVDDADYAQVFQGMSRCSNYTHDKALMGGVSVPDPDTLLVDINTLDNWRLRVEERSKEVAKGRKQAIVVAES